MILVNLERNDYSNLLAIGYKIFQCIEFVGGAISYSCQCCSDVYSNLNHIKLDPVFSECMDSVEVGNFKIS